MSGATPGYGTTRRGGRRLLRVSTGMVVGCAAAMGVAGWMTWTRMRHETAAPVAPVRSFDMGQDLPRPVYVHVAPAAPPKVVAVQPPEPVRPVVPPAAPVMAVWEAPDATQFEQRLQEQARAAREARSGGSGTGPGRDDAARPGGHGPAGQSRYAELMQTTQFANVAPIPPNLHKHYTIRKGTVFPCTPAQPISSALPGPIRCTTDQDVMSVDGTTVLLPKGTQINGTSEQALGNGADRLFLVWTDALTPAPDLLAIPLDAPAADELGQSGAPGDVNDHLWRKIKTTLLVSLIDIAGSVAGSAASSGRGNTILNLGSAGNTANSLGQMAFQHDLNIPATLYRGPGQPLTVYVSRYIDLVNYYQDVPAR